MSDRFMIIKTNDLEECEFYDDNGIPYSIKVQNKGKTREEWEDIVAKSIYNFTVKKYSSSLCGLNPDECEKVEQEARELAKSVVEELFK